MRSGLRLSTGCLPWRCPSCTGDTTMSGPWRCGHCGTEGLAAFQRCSVCDLLAALRPHAVWTNRHTGEETTITELASRVERVPDPNGLGFIGEPQLVVHHTVNVPPGMKRGYGDDSLSFVEHWQPARPGGPVPEREVSGDG